QGLGQPGGADIKGNMPGKVGVGQAQALVFLRYVGAGMVAGPDEGRSGVRVIPDKGCIEWNGDWAAKRRNCDRRQSHKIATAQGSALMVLVSMPIPAQRQGAAKR